MSVPQIGKARLAVRRLHDHRPRADNLKRRSGRKVIIAPDGSDAWAPAKPRPDETLIRALARAHRWKRMLEEVSVGGGDR